jgi:hypothetical protein
MDIVHRLLGRVLPTVSKPCFWESPSRQLPYAIQKIAGKINPILKIIQVNLLTNIFN